ncbi:MAG: hypothetical protein DME26_21805 [Verrucomicrobia bacterium]|nr:MAG: hypothetical protein DME26_21805 [Verrucomicrobiota bacterium]
MSYLAHIRKSVGGGDESMRHTKNFKQATAWHYLIWFAGVLSVFPGVRAADFNLFGQNTQARLVLSAASAKPGQPVMAGIHLRMGPGWHTYWINPGDSGMATKIDWALPSGITAGEIQWPVPETFTAGGLTTYVYQKEAVLLVPLTLASDVKPGPAEIKAKVSWLECRVECLPGKADVKATLIIGNESKPSADAGLIESGRKRLPRSGENVSTRAWWETISSGDTRKAVIEWMGTNLTTTADFYSLPSAEYTVGASNEVLLAQSNRVRLRKIVEKLGEAWPKQLAGLLVQRSGADPAPLAFAVNVPISEAPKTASVGELEEGFDEFGGSMPKSLWTMLVLAFFGGLILNVMPCVLPVIALKILGFVQQSKEEPKRVRKLGLIYALGVLFSFLILAGVVIGVQQAGHLASWGMQFQNVQFLVAMTLLITLVAMNLFGVFEVNLGSSAMSAAGELAAKQGVTGAFFNGILATALATPCTAPFLGLALGFAFAQSPPIIILMFSTVALGLAAPYVILSWKPGWLKFLPKPGAWMEKFKIAMGFPMLATAIWLFTLTISHFGKDDVRWFGLFLALFALAAWIWGEFGQRGSKRTTLALMISVLLVAVGYGYMMEGKLNWRSPRKAIASGGVVADPGGINWQTWSREAVRQARLEGRPVFVDFTADWCVTCQVNKRNAIDVPSVRAKFKEINAATFLADYTLEEETIGAELKRFRRAGVPLVVVYSKDPKARTMVLPEFLTPGIVLKALTKAAK